MENQIDPPENQNESKAAVQAKSSVKMKIWNIACIILFAAGVAFFIFFIDKNNHFLILNYGLLILSAAAAVVIISLCFIGTPKKIPVVSIVFLTIAGIVLAANWYTYFRYIPKYSLDDACAIVQAEPKYASAVIEPNYFDHTSIDGTIEKRLNSYDLEDNPYYFWGYVLNVVSDGKVITWLKFDPATGKYELFYEPKD